MAIEKQENTFIGKINSFNKNKLNIGFLFVGAKNISIINRTSAISSNFRLDLIIFNAIKFSIKIKLRSIWRKPTRRRVPTVITITAIGLRSCFSSSRNERNKKCCGRESEKYLYYPTMWQIVKTINFHISFYVRLFRSHTRGTCDLYISHNI